MPSHLSNATKIRANIGEMSKITSETKCNQNILHTSKLEQRYANVNLSNRWLTLSKVHWRRVIQSRAIQRVLDRRRSDLVVGKIKRPQFFGTQAHLSKHRPFRWHASLSHNEDPALLIFDRHGQLYAPLPYVLRINRLHRKRRTSYRCH